MKRYALVNVAPDQKVQTLAGEFIAKDITDEIADKILEKHPSCYFLEKVESKKANAKAEAQE